MKVIKIIDEVLDEIESNPEQFGPKSDYLVEKLIDIKDYLENEVEEEIEEDEEIIEDDTSLFNYSDN